MKRSFTLVYFFILLSFLAQSQNVGIGTNALNAKLHIKNLDDQLQAIQNPFVESVFINTKIKNAIGVFGSAVLSDPVRFIYPVNKKWCCYSLKLPAFQSPDFSDI